MTGKHCIILVSLLHLDISVHMPFLIGKIRGAETPSEFSLKPKRFPFSVFSQGGRLNNSLHFEGCCLCDYNFPFSSSV